MKKKPYSRTKRTATKSVLRLLDLEAAVLILIASVLSSPFCEARHKSPIPPVPSGITISYGPIQFLGQNQFATLLRLNRVSSDGRSRKRRKSMAESMEPYPKHLDWLRYLSAWLLFTYGSSKLLGWQFSLPSEVALRPIGSLSGYQLAWYYYSYSHTYALILGLVQLGGGAMLLFRKSATLGAAMMLPVMTNILMINLFFSIAWGALCTSAFILSAMLALLWRDRRALVDVFWTQQAAEPANVRRFHLLVAALVVLLVVVQMGVASWFHTAQRISK